MNKYHDENTGKPLNNTEPPTRGNWSLLHTDYDNLFKAIVTAAWNIKSGGDVESVTGSYALVEIPTFPGELAEMQDAVDDDTIEDEWPDCGWYVTIEDSDGLIYVYEFHNQRDAELGYDKLDDEYSDWCESAENEDANKE